jgi:hypothetical protein
MRECALVDPSGNLVRIGHELTTRQQEAPAAAAVPREE